MDLSAFFDVFRIPDPGGWAGSLVPDYAQPAHKKDSGVCIFMVYHEPLTENNIEHGPIINIFQGVTGSNGYGFVWHVAENQINCQLP